MSHDTHARTEARMQGDPGLAARLRTAGAVTQACLSVLFLSGCISLHAKNATEAPALETPEAPPRVVEANDPATPAIVSLPDEPARNTPPRPRPQPPAQRADAPRPVEPPKPDVPVEIPKTTDEAVRPPATLQTTPAQQEGEFERRIRGLVTRANTDLGRVNYQNLNSDGRTQYETAKRFMSQADEALKAKNMVFANNLAEKAAALAAELAGR